MTPEPEPKPVARPELKSRMLSAAVLAPVALAAVIVGGIPFALLAAAVAALAFWEWCEITAVQPGLLRIAGAVLAAAGAFSAAIAPIGTATLLIGVPAVLALAAGFRARAFGWAGAGLLYVGMPCIAFIVLRNAEPNGWAAILYLLAVVWTTDTAAYFGGRRFGGPKLWPQISPKKTWSGALSGLAGAMLAGGVVAAVTGAAGILAGAAFAAPLSVAAQGGDLLESAIKRRFGVKDSGHIIPGHGGVLDRVDGLLAAAALAWFIAALGMGGSLLALPRTLPTTGGG